MSGRAVGIGVCVCYLVRLKRRCLIHQTLFLSLVLSLSVSLSPCVYGCGCEYVQTRLFCLSYLRSKEREKEDCFFQGDLSNEYRIMGIEDGLFAYV